MGADVTITCPHCGHAAAEAIGRLRGTRIYKCRHCRILLRARHTDCCVACAFGDRGCGPAAGNLATLGA